jgi:chemotaxis protein methyltransferase CheR
MDDFRVEHCFPGIGRRTMLLNARQLHAKEGRPVMILLAIEDAADGEKATKGQSRTA